ncbi:hypothetical protein B0H11DRAFT_2218239 [Mycena galericulata]|nr:hypothetical protein B0H11DRAFT_2218239 [Mycena galericulata]
MPSSYSSCRPLPPRLRHDDLERSFLLQYALDRNVYYPLAACHARRYLLTNLNAFPASANPPSATCILLACFTSPANNHPGSCPTCACGMLSSPSSAELLGNGRRKLTRARTRTRCCILCQCVSMREVVAVAAAGAGAGSAGAGDGGFVRSPMLPVLGAGWGVDMGAMAGRRTSISAEDMPHLGHLDRVFSSHHQLRRDMMMDEAEHLNENCTSDMRPRTLIKPLSLPTYKRCTQKRLVRNVLGHLASLASMRAGGLVAAHLPSPRACAAATGSCAVAPTTTMVPHTAPSLSRSPSSLAALRSHIEPVLMRACAATTLVHHIASLALYLAPPNVLQTHAARIRTVPYSVRMDVAGIRSGCAPQHACMEVTGAGVGIARTSCEMDSAAERFVVDSDLQGSQDPGRVRGVLRSQAVAGW